MSAAANPLLSETHLPPETHLEPKAAAGAPPSAAEAHDRGLAARRAGDREAAADWFQRALAAQPDHRPSRVELATTLRELGRLAGAEQAYRALAADEPTWFYPKLGLGLCARLRRDLPAAAEHFAAAVAAAPRDRSARLEHATALRELGRFAEAEIVYQALLDDEPGQYHALLGLGLCARRRGDLAAAVAPLAAAVAAAPRERAAQVEYATTLRELGRTEAAEAAYRALAATEPDWFYPKLGLGLCARQRHDLAAAVAHFAAAVAAAPRDRSARLEHATALRELGRFAEAEIVYQALLDDEPGQYHALLGLGLCARRRGDLAAAVAPLAAAVAAAPRERAAQVEYATTLRELGRTEAAEAAYRALAATEPDWFYPKLGLGLCARQRHDLAAAVAHFAAAVAAAPRDRSARLEHATALRELGRVAEAETAYQRLLDDAPGFYHALLGLGLCARQRRDLPAAVAPLAAAVAAAPRERAAQVEYATTLRELGRTEAAEAAYRALAATEPDWFYPKLGLGLCARLRRDLPAAVAHFAAAVAAAPQDRSARLEYATALRELGRTAEAEAVYRGVLDDAPGLHQALVGLGQCARQRGDHAAAVAHFTAAATAAAELGPAAVDAADLDLAGMQRDAGDFAAARALGAAVTARRPDNPLAWFGLGRTERAAGDRAAALATFRQGYETCPEQHHFLIEMAADGQALGQFAEAEAWLRRAAAIEPLAAAALTQLGELARVGQQFEQALELFQQAVALPDAPAGAHVSLAQTLADLGRFDAALAALATATAVLGPRPDLAVRHASLLRRAGRRDEAAALVREAAAAAPLHFPLWFERFENERFASFDTIADCLAAAPAVTARERAHVHHAHGAIAEQRWQLDAAAGEFAAATALEPGIAWMHESLARVSLLRFDPQAARRHLQASVLLDAPVRLQQGLSPNLCHTHVGQILDEFLMDAPATAALADAGTLAPDARIAPLLALVRDAPDHTPTAIALLLALRQAGRFTAPDGAGEGSRIPAAIAQYWDRDPPPDDVAAVMQSWPAHNPGHRYVRFDHAAARGYLAARCTPDVLRAYQRAREPAMKADLFRLAWLFCDGGVYADADDRCLRPLATLLPRHASFVGYQEEYGTLGNNFLAASPFHPVIGLALRLATTAINRGDDDLLWLATGPGLISRAFAQTLATSCLQPESWLAGTTVFNRHELLRGVGTACMLGYKHTRRHWARAAFSAPRAANNNA